VGHIVASGGAIEVFEAAKKLEECRFRWSS